MEEKRARRPVFCRGQAYSLLPVRARSHSNTISCWYCDLKISLLNKRVFLFGRRHARFLRSWFSVGVGFALSSLVAVTIIILWEALHMFNVNAPFSNALNALLFGISPGVEASIMVMSLADAGYLLMSSLIAVCIHESGHALAAACEGVQLEYIAIFLAVIFPGALVAFNSELLEALPHSALLRVYSAGIWHNAVCCAACVFALVLLPFILSPYYLRGENPMVLDVPSSSPLSGYLYNGDIIEFLDAFPIHDVKEWAMITANIHQMSLMESNHSDKFTTTKCRKGYCVPDLMINESNRIKFIDNQAICSHNVSAVHAFACSGSSTKINSNPKLSDQREKASVHCFDSADLVRYNKCGDQWITGGFNRSFCLCSEDEYCCSTLVPPGLTWVEISYSRPYATECLKEQRNILPGSFKSREKCGGTFVFVGDLLSMSHSIQLSSYRPRWGFPFGVFLPQVLENIFICTFHVSLALALFNSLPVYLLDGEAILEASVVGYLNLSKRCSARVVKVCLFVGTILSILAFCGMIIHSG